MEMLYFYITNYLKIKKENYENRVKIFGQYIFI